MRTQETRSTTVRHAPAVARTLAALRRRPPTLDVTEAAGWLGVSRSSAYTAIANDTFPVAVVRVNRKLRVLTADLLRLLESGKAAGSH
jgi:predicted DNA-binding transcriptional regulator AlpA